MKNNNFPQCSVYIATSLDGFIARKDGNIDWLMSANNLVPAGEDCGYKEFMNTIDILIMGRNSFETVLAFDEWPYGDKKVIVMSKKGVEISEKIKKTVSTTSETPYELLNRLAELGNVKRVYIDGGLTIQSFLFENLIDDFTITTIPVLLGEGLPLFGKLKNDLSLTLVKNTAYPFGFIQNTYKVNKG